MVRESHMQLKALNTFGIAAIAQRFVPINTLADIHCFLTNPTFQQPLPLRILGGGSNVLFCTAQINGTILHNRLRGIEVVQQDAEYVWLRAASGENWHDLVQYALRHNWGGIENLSLIPGTVGAAPIQNIGAYGVELSHVLDKLSVIDLHDGQSQTLSAESCELGYRDSIFKRTAKDRYFITDITLRLSRRPQLQLQYGDIGRTLSDMGIGDKPTIQDVSAAVCRIRRSKLPDPKELGNAGSFFKNPEIDSQQYETLKIQFATMPAYPLPNGRVKIPAAWLIEQCQWRGRRQGDAGVHQNHALVLVNYGAATGSQLLALAQQIQTDIQQKMGITLQPEVNIWE